MDNPPSAVTPSMPTSTPVSVSSEFMPEVRPHDGKGDLVDDRVDPSVVPPPPSGGYTSSDRSLPAASKKFWEHRFLRSHVQHAFPLGLWNDPLVQELQGFPRQKHRSRQS